MKNQTNLVRPLTLVAVLLFLLLMSHISFAQTRSQVRNIVIVHGAFVASGHYITHKAAQLLTPKPTISKKNTNYV